MFLYDIYISHLMTLKFSQNKQSSASEREVQYIFCLLNILIATADMDTGVGVVPLNNWKKSKEQLLLTKKPTSFTEAITMVVVDMGVDVDLLMKRKFSPKC